MNLCLNDKNKSSTISAIRFIAMILIILCHFMQYYNMELAFWFNVGVQIFFCLSGFLYGNKKIDNAFEFIKNNFKKILIPYYVFIFITICIYCLFASQYITLNTIIKLLFASGTVKGIGHLWFVSYILFCYLITPCLSMLKDKIDKLDCKKTILLCGGLIVFDQLLALNYNFYFSMDKINCYLIGYFIAILLNKFGEKSLKDLGIVTTSFAIFTNAIRIYLKYFRGFKNTFIFEYFEKYSHLLLGVALFLLLYILLKNISYNILFEFSDKYSYYVYIVHQLFILSPFTLMKITFVDPLNWIIVLFAIISSAIILKNICDKVRKYL